MIRPNLKKLYGHKKTYLDIKNPSGEARTFL
nr:MAG TPA: hypothetical protein [Caudoviricetes sp.]